MKIYTRISSYFQKYGNILTFLKEYGLGIFNEKYWKRLVPSLLLHTRILVYAIPFVSYPTRTGYRYDTALLLSVFGGVLGLDRFYLGYPAIGLFKLCTFAACGLLYLLDLVLIAFQVSTTALSFTNSFLVTSILI